jgi:hypothetical protein
MRVLHLINKQNDKGPGLRNLQRLEGEKDTYLSGYWDIPLAEAQTLVGGMLFLHEAKAKPSRFGGKVLSVEQVRMEEFAHKNRIVFKILSLLEGRGAKWRGADHAMASYGRILDLDDPH